MPPSAISHATVDQQRLPAGHKSSKDTDLPWRCSVSWRWGPSASTKGTFTGCLLRALSTLAGFKWHDAGHTAWSALYALQTPLDFKHLLWPSSNFTQEVADAWNGDILLMYPQPSTSDTLSRESPGLLAHQAAHNTGLHYLCDILQGSRMSSCLKASGAALMAQGSSTAYQEMACEHAQQGLERSSALAKTDVDSTGSNTSQTPGGPPAINILLVAPEDLQSWLPENVLSKQQLADVATKASTHQVCTCALLLMQTPTPPSKSVLKGSQTQQQPTQAEAQPVCSMQQQTASDSGVKHKDIENSAYDVACSSSGAPSHPDDVFWPDVPAVLPHAPACRAQSDSVNTPVEQADSTFSAHPPQQAKRVLQQADEVSNSSEKRRKLQLSASEAQQQEQPPVPLSAQEHSPQMFDNEIIGSILNSIEQMGWLQSCENNSMAPEHMVQLQAQPLLTQLRILSIFASSYSADCTVGNHFTKTHQRVTQILKGTSWLARRCGPASQRKLSHEAQNLLNQLSSYSVLPSSAVPHITADVIPVDLQTAYVLCLAGYAGSRPLPDFAADVMHCILLDAKQAVQHSQTDKLVRQEVQASFELASEFTLRAARASFELRIQVSEQQPVSTTPNLNVPVATASAAIPVMTLLSTAALAAPSASTTATPHDRMLHPLSVAALPSAAVSKHNNIPIAAPANQPVKYSSLDVRYVRQTLDTAESALTQLHCQYKCLPNSCLEVLYAKPLLSQLLILSEFCLKVKPRMNPASYLVSLCIHHDENLAANCALQMQNHSSNRPILISTPVRNFLDTAQQMRILGSRAVLHMVEAAIMSLPPSLHGLAACYAIGLFTKHAGWTLAMANLRQAIAQLQLIVVQTRLAES